MGDLKDLVWYASYGSNCDLSRFMFYLEGGTRAGTNGEHRGARDPSPPMDSAPIEFPTQVAFMGKSRRWGGGVAFLEHQRRTPDVPGALGRRYLITREQFDDVVAQESHRPSTPIDVDALTPGVVNVVGSGWYDGLLALESVDDMPVVTFTSPTPPEAGPANPPSVDYLTTLAAGLSQIHLIDLEQIVDRLRVVDVIASNWSREQLLEVLETTGR